MATVKLKCGYCKKIFDVKDKKWTLKFSKVQCEDCIKKSKNKDELDIFDEL